NSQPRPVEWVWIKDDQRRRPEELAQVTTVGDEGVCQPLRERNPSQPEHSRPLRQESQHAPANCQDKERELVKKAKTWSRDSGACAVAGESTVGSGPSGQKSSNTSTNGSVTSIGLDMRPRMKQKRDSA